MKNNLFTMGKTLYELQLEGRIQGYKDHIKALENAIDEICILWDEDRSKIKEVKNEQD